MAVSESNIENLFEFNATNLIFTAKHLVKSEKHPTVLYDFNRTKVTTEAQLAKGYVVEADLTTLNANGGVGKRAWNSTGGTKAPTPYLDLQTAVRSVLRRSSVDCIVMSSDAYPYLEADITTNYAKAADLTVEVASRIELQIVPQMGKFQDLVLRRVINFNIDGTGAKVSIPIYTYDAIYHDRTIADQTAAEKAYVPNGYFAVLPSKDKGVRFAGRILHPKAQFGAQPRFLNTWYDDKTGMQESEMQLNFLMGMKDVDSFASWKVLA
jgi:hypothetical protein